MANPFAIVQFQVSEIEAPQPNTLQRTYCIISQGGTTIPTGTTELITSPAGLIPITPTSLTISAISWASNVVTVATATPHGITTGDVISMTVAGVTPSGYNGTFSATATGASALTYPLLTNPGTETILGTITPADVAHLASKINGWYNQGSAIAVYVLELGITTTVEGLAAFETFMTENVNAFYAFLLPASWAASTAVSTYVGTFTAPTALQYFWVTASTGNYTNFLGLKSAIVWVPAPNTPTTEFSAAADFYVWANQNPSSSNPLTPNQFNFLFGVTPWQIPNNQTVLAQLKAAFVNVVAPASVGGLSDSMVFLGTTMDGNQLGFWYSQDWVQINGQLNLDNYVITQTQNKQNPLVYNQPGIDRLQRNLLSTMSQAITNKMANGTLTQANLPIAQFQENLDNGVYNGQIVVNAEPYTAYTSENPDDYSQGAYNGLTALMITQDGFIAILVNLTVTQFVSV